jgi:predicted metal-binding membrane protein
MAAAAWVVLIDQASGLGGTMAPAADPMSAGGGMGMDGGGMDSGSMDSGSGMAVDSGSALTMGMGAALYIGLWGLMMVAIMFPSAAPMILMFARVQASRSEKGQPYVPTWIFTSAYLALWVATGVVAYVLAVGADALAQGSPWLMENGARIGGALLVAAGIYQLTPAKEVCLEKCRSPLSFLTNSWEDGAGGALRMGLRHGAYCIGCCWLLFLILFPLGMMNVVAMAAIAALILAEKVLPWGNAVRYVAAAALIGFGAYVIFMPEALPTTL